MINCYSKNGWDPLETVLLGGFIEPDTLKVILDYSKFDPIRPWLMKIAQETEEDLDNIQYVLEQHGVQVIRPDWELIREEQVRRWRKGDTEIAPISPRNDLFVYKDMVIARSDSLAGQPWESIIENDIVDLSGTVLQSIHLPCIFRCNDRLIIGNEISEYELERLIHVLPYKEYVRTDVDGHVDARMATLREGLVVYAIKDIEQTLINETFPGWKHIFCDKYGFNADPRYYSEEPPEQIDETLRALTNNRWDIFGYNGDNPKEVASLIDDNFSNWTGKAYETHFDVNILTINPNLSITVGTDKELVKQIEQEGHELIVVPLRHRWFFDQGLHCMTCDLVRKHDNNN